MQIPVTEKQDKMSTSSADSLGAGSNFLLVSRKRYRYKVRLKLLIQRLTTRDAQEKSNVN